MCYFCPAVLGSTTADAGATPTAPESRPSAPPMTFMRVITLLDSIPGVNQQEAELLVAEWGIDMERFGTAPRLAAWSGIAPGNNESGGIQRSGTTRKGNRALRTGLVQMAHAAAHTKDTYVSALYHRLAARHGKKRAIIAVAHSRVRSAFHMLSRNEPYHELGGNYFDEHRLEHLVDRLTRRIERLGYRVALEPVVTS
jgi:transposase